MLLTTRRISTWFKWLARNVRNWSPTSTLEGWLLARLLTWLVSILKDVISGLHPLKLVANQLWYDSHHDTNDVSHAWVANFWRSHPSLLKSNNFITTTGVRGVLPTKDIVAARLRKEEDREAQEAIQPIFEPQGSETLTFWFQRTLFRLDHRRQKVDWARGVYHPGGVWISSIRIRVFARDRGVLLRFLQQAKSLHEATRPPRIALKSYQAGSSGPWSTGLSRQKRAWENVILPADIKQHIQAEVESFLESETFYGARGLAHKRGMLLSGPPGTGKTSTILGLASKYNLPIYTLPLTSEVSDSAALAAMRSIPGKAIIVLEDLDVWNKTKRQDYEAIEAGGPSDAANDPQKQVVHQFASPKPTTVSLSALLAILDGVESSDGKLFIMTTNHVEGLDPALLREGRCDVKIKFRKTSIQQAFELFINFYHPHGQEAIPGFDDATLMELAKAWTQDLADEEFSVAALQGMLLLHKSDPRAAVAGMAAWVLQNRTSSQKDL